MENRTDIPELKLDRTKMRVVEGFDDSDEIEYWRQTTVKERLQHIERLRRLNYGSSSYGKTSKSYSSC